MQGKPVPLSPKSLEILVILIQNNGRLLTKGELTQQVWADSFVEEANLTVNISPTAQSDRQGEPCGARPVLKAAKAECEVAVTAMVIPAKIAL